jgi:hypothetical protein
VGTYGEMKNFTSFFYYGTSMVQIHTFKILHISTFWKFATQESK